MFSTCGLLNFDGRIAFLCNGSKILLEQLQVVETRLAIAAAAAAAASEGSILGGAICIVVVGNVR